MEKFKHTYQTIEQSLSYNLVKLFHRKCVGFEFLIVKNCKSCFLPVIGIDRSTSLLPLVNTIERVG